MEKRSEGSAPSLMVPSYFGGYGPPARFRARNNPVDAEKYDFRAARTHLKRTNSVTESTCHMLMSGFSGGLVVMHYAYKLCGMWTALFLNLLFPTIIGYCGCILVWSAQKTYGRVLQPLLTYPDLIEAAFLICKWRLVRKLARPLRYIVEGTLLIHIYASCAAFLTLIARNLKELVEGDATVSDEGDPPLYVYVMALVVPCILICMVTDLKNLAPFGLICVLYAGAVVLTLLWYGLRGNKESPLARSPYNGPIKLFEFMVIVAFLLEPVSYALPVENNMEEPKKFHKVIIAALSTCSATMVLVGFIGFWHYGETSIPPLVVHFPFSPIPVTLKVFLCLILYVIYAMRFYVGFDIEWFYLKRNHQMSNFWFWERFYRIINVILISMLSFGIPNSSRLMGLFGSIGIVPATFIFPPIIELLLDWDYPGLGKYKWRLFKAIAIVLLGLTLMFGGETCNILSSIKDQTFKISSNVTLHERRAPGTILFKFIPRNTTLVPPVFVNQTLGQSTNTLSKSSWTTLGQSISTLPKSSWTTLGQSISTLSKSSISSNLSRSNLSLTTSMP